MPHSKEIIEFIKNKKWSDKISEKNKPNHN